MGMENYSKYQQGIIKRYYNNADQIQLQRLGELCTEIYLAEGKKLEKLWASAMKAMETLKVPPDRIAKILAEKKPVELAKIVQELQGKA